MTKKKATRNNERHDGFEYVIKENLIFDQVTISFQLPSRGWKKLKKSKFWHQACEYFSEAQKEHSQM